MEFYPPVVGLSDREFQGVPPFGGSLSATSGQVCAPWLERRLVKRVGHRAHLEEDGVQTCRAGHIKQRYHFPLLGFGHRWGIAGLGGPVNPVNGSHPQAPHLLLGRRISRRAPPRQEESQQTRTPYPD